MTRHTASKRGYDNRWQKYRINYLQRYPLCCKCKKKGVVRAANVVDHIVPPRMNDALNSKDPVRIAEARRLFWKPTNHQSLCDECHNSDKQREERGTEAGCDLNGIPHARSHHWNQ